MPKKSQKPKISIIVSCYKGGDYLPTCLDSLLGQTFEEIEIICINDGSPDDTADIIDRYAKQDKRIVPVHNEENLGISKSRNNGIERARADFVMFCDCDDYYEPSMCEEMYNVVTENDVDIAISEINVIYEAHEEMKYSDDNYYSLKFTDVHDISEEIILNTDLSPTNKIFRKSIIEKYSIRFPEGLYYEDAFFCTAYMFCSKNIYFLNERLYNYIRHEHSTMSNTWSDDVDKDPAINHLYIAFRLFDFLQENHKIKEYSNAYWRLFYSFELFAANNSKTRTRVREVKQAALEFVKDHAESLDSAEPDTKEAIMALSSFGLRINSAKIKNAIVFFAPSYRLQRANIRNLRRLKNNARQLNKKIDKYL